MLVRLYVRTFVRSYVRGSLENYSFSKEKFDQRVFRVEELESDVSL